MRRVIKLALIVLPVCSLGLGYASAHEPSIPKAHGNPLAALQRASLDDPPLRGTVEQRLAAGSYHYLAVRASDRALHWAVTMGGGEPVGTRVVVRSLAHSASFYSPRLSRRFSDLAFGIVSRDDSIEEPRP